MTCKDNPSDNLKAQSSPQEKTKISKSAKISCHRQINGCPVKNFDNRISFTWRNSH